MNRIEKAELLASFMGALRYRPTENFIEYAPGQTCNLKDAEYHSSWDWLMPVVEKCMRTGDNTHERDALYDALSTVNKAYIHEVVVEFIQWYNKNN